MKLKHLAILTIVLLGLAFPFRVAEAYPYCIDMDPVRSETSVNCLEASSGLRVSGGTSGVLALGEPEIEGVWAGATHWMCGLTFLSGETFHESIAKGINFNGSNLQNSDYLKVIIVLDTGAANQTLCHTIISATPAGVGTFPGQAWDMTDPFDPRRLNLCFRERSTSNNSQWDPDATGKG